MKIVWICVNYRSYPSVEHFLRSMDRVFPGGAELQVILVDNSLKEDEPSGFAEFLAGLGLNVFWVRTYENLGYFGAVNRAMLVAADAIAEANWTIVSNVDMELRDSGFFLYLIQKNADSINGIIAPAIRSLSSGRNLNPQMKYRPSAIRMLFYAIVFSNYWTQNAYNCLSWVKHKVKSAIRLGLRGVEAEETEIYAGHGSCLVFSRYFFERGGNFLYPSFLFNEEIFLAEMAIQNGFSVLYAPRLEIYDFEHVGTGHWHNRRIAKWVGDSSRYVYRRYWKKG